VLGARLRLRGADSVYVTVAATLHVPLVTWDQALAARAAPLVHTFSP